MNREKIKKDKEPKKKPQYSVWQNLKFIFANVWKWDKPMLFISALRIPTNVLTPLMWIYLSKYVVDIVTQNGSMEQLLLNILIFSIGIFALQTINNFISSKVDWQTLFMRLNYPYLL